MSNMQHNTPLHTKSINNRPATSPLPAMFDKINLSDLTFAQLNTTLEQQCMQSPIKPTLQHTVQATPATLFTPNQYANVQIEPTVRKPELYTGLYNHTNTHTTQFPSTAYTSIPTHSTQSAHSSNTNHTHTQLNSNTVSTANTSQHNNIQYSTQHINDVTQQSHNTLANLNELYKQKFALIYEKLNADFLYSQQRIEQIKAYYFNDLKKHVAQIEAEYKHSLHSEVERYNNTLQQQKVLDIASLRKQAQLLCDTECNALKYKLNQSHMDEINTLRQTLDAERETTLQQLQAQLQREQQQRVDKVKRRHRRHTDKLLIDIQAEHVQQCESELFLLQQQLRLQQSDSVEDLKLQLQQQLQAKLQAERDKYVAENSAMLEKQKQVFDAKYHDTLHQLQSELRTDLLNRSTELLNTNMQHMSDAQHTMYKMYQQRLSNNFSTIASTENSSDTGFL